MSDGNAASAPRFAGIDFSSAPSRRKPIVVATAAWAGGAGRLALLRIERLATLAEFEHWLVRETCWVGGFDFPFGLPREFAQAQDWLAPTLPAGRQWAHLIGRLASVSRRDLVDRCRTFAAARPVGRRFAHRRTDGPAGSSPSMKWVNPPVVLMLHAGAPRLLQAGVCLPGHCDGDPQRVALEAYPGLLAREVIGRRSYKNDDPKRYDAARRANRADLVAALVEGAHRLRIGIDLDAPTVAALLEEPGADPLDAVICAVQAAWAWQRRDAGYGHPADVDPCEGWIVSAVEDDAPQVRRSAAFIAIRS